MAGANIHGTCVRIGPHGVLLLGPSGSGKSDLALRLISGGAQLVADDRCELFVERGRLSARPPAPLAGLLEVRGLGILKFPHAAKARVALVVQLDKDIERMPVHRLFEAPPPLALQDDARPPLLLLNPFEISAPAKITAALLAFSQGLFRERSGPT